MLITLEQKEIESMILAGLTTMGIPHEGAVIKMIAGRNPAGVSAEVRLGTAKTVTGSYGEGPSGFSGESNGPAVETTHETLGSNNPDGIEAAIKEAAGDDDHDVVAQLEETPEPKDSTALFDS